MIETVNETAFELQAEHVEMETGVYGDPDLMMVSNSTRAWYSETFVCVSSAQEYLSRDHARAGIL